MASYREHQGSNPAHANMNQSVVEPNIRRPRQMAKAQQIVDLLVAALAFSKSVRTNCNRLLKLPFCMVPVAKIQGLCNRHIH